LSQRSFHRSQKESWKHRINNHSDGLLEYKMELKNVYETKVTIRKKRRKLFISGAKFYGEITRDNAKFYTDIKKGLVQPRDFASSSLVAAGSKAFLVGGLENSCQYLIK